MTILLHANEAVSERDYELTELFNYAAACCSNWLLFPFGLLFLCLDKLLTSSVAFVVEELLHYFIEQGE